MLFSAELFFINTFWRIQRKKRETNEQKNHIHVPRKEPRLGTFFDVVLYRLDVFNFFLFGKDRAETSCSIHDQSM
jgi:hypothetical protein